LLVDLLGLLELPRRMLKSKSVSESGTITLSELKPGQQYTVHLSAGNDVGFGPSVKFIVNTPTLEQSGSSTYVTHQ